MISFNFNSNYYLLTGKYKDGDYVDKMKLLGKSIEWCEGKAIVQLAFVKNYNQGTADTLITAYLYLLFEKNDFQKGLFVYHMPRSERIIEMKGSAKLDTHVFKLNNINLKTKKIIKGDDNYLGHDIVIDKIVFNKDNYFIETFMCPNKFERQDIVLKELGLLQATSTINQE